MNTLEPQAQPIESQPNEAQEIRLESILAAVLLESIGQWKAKSGENELLDSLESRILQRCDPDSIVHWNEAPELSKFQQILDLSDFEFKTLLLCAARERIPESATLFSAYNGSAQQTQPTFGFCEDLLPGAKPEASSTAGPLRYWRLIELGNTPSIRDAPLSIDERILAHLQGFQLLDTRLEPYLEPMHAIGEADHDRYAGLCQRIVEAWRHAENFFDFPAIQLLTQDIDAARELALTLAQHLGLQAYTLKTSQLPETAYERNALQRIWEREALLRRALLYAEREALSEKDTLQNANRDNWVSTLKGPVVIGAVNGAEIRNRPSLTLTVPCATRESRFAAISRALSANAFETPDSITQVSDHFQLSEAALQRATFRALQTAQESNSPSDALFKALWESCKEESRNGFGPYAQRLEVARDWNALVLPEKQADTLLQITRQARHQAKVHDRWGFAANNPHGLGITALFAGPSGTGKTLAAEVIAHELNLDLFRIDLSAVVSKYIGETEENLRRVFDTAEAGGCILLFDEADSLFGARSEIKDSRDRSANMEVGYLLQRMESYRGLAILTTNFKQTIDKAFLRRIRFMVDFPYPDTALRIQLWQKAFPQDAPTHELDYAKLAKLSLAGGNIRNVALNAAFIAADNGQVIGMEHIQASMRHELAKLDRPINETDIKALCRSDSKTQTEP